MGMSQWESRYTSYKIQIGFALGVDELSQGAVGGFIGGLLGGEFSSSAEGGITGKVLQVQERGFWQEGWDVEVRWKLKKDGKNIQHEAWCL